MELLFNIILLIVQVICVGMIVLTITGWRIRTRNSSDNMLNVWDEIEN